MYHTPTGQDGIDFVSSHLTGLDEFLVSRNNIVNRI